MPKRSLPHGVIPRSFHIDIPPLLDFKIRSGRLWGKTQDKILIFSDLNIKPQPKLQYFTSFKQIDFYSVHSDGGYCFVKTLDNKYFILSVVNDVSQKEVKIFDKVTAISWATLKNNPQPFAFFVTDKLYLGYFNLNTQLTACSIVPLDPPLKDRIDFFNILQFQDERIVFSYFVGDNLTQRIFENGKFSQIKDTQRSTTIFGFDPKRHPYFMENEYLAFSTRNQQQFMFYNIKLDPTIPKVTGSQVYRNLTNFNINFENDDIKNNKIAITHNIIYQFVKNKVSFYIISHNHNEDAVFSMTLPNANIFELDTVTGVIYSIKNNSIASYSFVSKYSDSTGFDVFRYWLFSHLMEQKKEDPAVEILSQSSTSFDRIIRFSKNQPDTFRLKLFKILLANAKQVHKLQCSAIAICILDLYVRISCMETDPTKKEERINEFIQWAKSMEEKQILTKQIIEKALIEYDWIDAYRHFLQPAAKFDLNMLLGKYQEAEEDLKQIREPNLYASAALRLSAHMKENVIADISARNDLSSKIIPLITNDKFLPALEELAALGRLESGWLKRLFALCIAHKPNSASISDFYKDCLSDHFSDRFSENFSCSQTLLRSLCSAKLYLEAAKCICQDQEFLPFAVGIAALKSPEDAFDLIPPNAPITVKRRCALRILRSIKKDDTAIVAKKLLTSTNLIDMVTLIEFLPGTTSVREVSKSIYKYSINNQDAAKEEKKKSDAALKDISDTNELISTKSANVVKLFKYHTCSKCGKLLLNETGIVYPCSHALHQHCASEILETFPQSFGQEMNISDDCPICGFVCVRMIDHPFEPECENQNFVDPWSVDRETLGKKYNFY